MAIHRRSGVWQCRDRTLSVGERTLIMGVLNITPDSFSDGGRYFERERAVEHALRMAGEGADIVDVGGESTRPGSQRVEVEEELRRVIPVIEAVAAETDCLVSIDTMKARVAERAMAAGAHIINDVSALTGDPDVAAVAREHGAGVVLMHMRGEPRTMQEDPRYEDVVEEVTRYLAARVEAAVRAGISPEHLAVDPGIGFGKTVEHNLELINGLPELARLGRPLLVGLSRKSFLGKITGREVQDRLPATLGVTAYAIARGAHVVRVHDVKETCDVVRVVDILLAGALAR